MSDKKSVSFAESLVTGAAPGENIRVDDHLLKRLAPGDDIYTEEDDTIDAKKPKSDEGTNLAYQTFFHCHVLEELPVNLVTLSL